MNNNFFPVYPEMLAEFGASVTCLVYAAVGRFSINGGKGLYLSKAKIASTLHCSKSQVCEAIAKLLEDTDTTKDKDERGEYPPKEPFIIAESRKRADGGQDTTIYKINPQHPLSRIWTTPVRKSDNPCPEIGQPLSGTPDNPCPEIGQPTIKENYRESCKERGRENTREESGSDSGEISRAETTPPNCGDSLEPLSLGEKEEFFIRYKVDYERPKPNNTHKHSAEHYIDLVTSREYPLARVFRFLRDDYYILTDEEAQQRKADHEHSESLLDAWQGWSASTDSEQITESKPESEPENQIEPKPEKITIEADEAEPHVFMTAAEQFKKWGCLRYDPETGRKL